MTNSTKSLRWLPVGALALVVAACATIGTPEGGPRDFTPPEVTRTNPPQGALNWSGNRMTVTLNKNVQLDDAFNKVVVSPAQKTPPQITSNGHNITVEFRDTLLPNTTYTVDFADAIKDLNEGNILDGFATDFSTGASLDTLRISGMVLEARTLEPAKGMIVGAYSNLSDTAITTLPFERVAKTNALGQFTLRNLAEGTYHIFAVNDINRDWHWDRSEDVAFYGIAVTPTSERIQVQDTLVAADGRDSIALREVTRFMPNDLLLTWFNENYRAQYIVDYSRPERNRLSLTLGAPADSLPRMSVVAPETLAGINLADTTPDAAATIAVLDRSVTNDTINIWLRDRRLLTTDTLRVAVGIQVPDSTGALVWKTDTLRFSYREPKKTKKEIQAEEAAAKMLAQERQALADSLGVPVDSLPPIIPPRQVLQFTISGGGRQDIAAPMLFSSPRPVDTIIASGIHLQMLVDTIWTDLPAPTLYRPRPGKPMEFRADYDWTPGAKYKLIVDSATVHSMYDTHNDRLVREFKVGELSDYGSIIFRVSGTPDTIPCVVELLNNQDNPVRSQTIVNGVVRFEYLDAGTYYARLFVDKDADGKYGNGSLSSTPPQQPDDVYYYPKKITLKKNWDMDQSWDINLLPVDQQKPFDIKKNKPKGAVNPDAGKEEEDNSPLPPGLE